MLRTGLYSLQWYLGNHPVICLMHMGLEGSFIFLPSQSTLGVDNFWFKSRLSKPRGSVPALNPVSLLTTAAALFHGTSPEWKQCFFLIHKFVKLCTLNNHLVKVITYGILWVYMENERAKSFKLWQLPSHSWKSSPRTPLCQKNQQVNRQRLALFLSTDDKALPTTLTLLLNLQSSWPVYTHTAPKSVSEMGVHLGT